MNKISKTIILSLAGLSTLGCVVGNVFANFIVKDNADPFGARIVPLPGTTFFDVTYHIPAPTKDDPNAFSEETIQVAENTNLYTALSGFNISNAFLPFNFSFFFIYLQHQIALI